MTENRDNAGASSHDAPQLDPFSKMVTSFVVLQLGHVKVCEVLSVVPMQQWLLVRLPRSRLRLTVRLAAIDALDSLSDF